MPKVTGVEFLAQILDDYPDPVRMILTGFSDAEAIIGAILFMVVVCIISFHYAKTNAFLYNLIRKTIDKLKK